MGMPQGSMLGKPGREPMVATYDVLVEPLPGSHGIPWLLRAHFEECLPHAFPSSLTSRKVFLGQVQCSSKCTPRSHGGSLFRELVHWRKSSDSTSQVSSVDLLIPPVSVFGIAAFQHRCSFQLFAARCCPHVKYL